MTDARPRDLDPGEEKQDSGREQPQHSRTYLVFRWLSENLMLVVAALGLGAFVLASFLDVGIPRNLRIIGLAAIIMIPIAGVPTGRKVKDLLWNPNWVYIVDIDARYQTGAIYRTPSQQFREWDVTDGALDWLTPNLVCGKSVDLEAQTIEGTWRGSLTDRELLRALQAVEECRGSLEEDAKRGFAIEAQSFSIIRSATRKAVLSVVSTFERGTLPDEGEGLTSEIDAAIEQFGLERNIRSGEDSDVPDPSGDLDDLGDDLENIATNPEVPADD